MKPRCTGAKTPGHFTSFECVLDEGHDGFCEPYVPPTVDEWRVTMRRADVLRGLVNDLCSYDPGDAGRIIAENARLHSELDALRAILASGCDACAHGTPRV